MGESQSSLHIITSSPIQVSCLCQLRTATSTCVYMWGMAVQHLECSCTSHSGHATDMIKGFVTAFELVNTVTISLILHGTFTPTTSTDNNSAPPHTPNTLVYFALCSVHWVNKAVRSITADLRCRYYVLYSLWCKMLQECLWVHWVFQTAHSAGSHEHPTSCEMRTIKTAANHYTMDHWIHHHIWSILHHSSKPQLRVRLVGVAVYKWCTGLKTQFSYLAFQSNYLLQVTVVVSLMPQRCPNWRIHT